METQVVCSWYLSVSPHWTSTPWGGWRLYLSRSPQHPHCHSGTWWWRVLQTYLWLNEWNVLKSWIFLNTYQIFYTGVLLLGNTLSSNGWTTKLCWLFSSIWRIRTRRWLTWSTINSWKKEERPVTGRSHLKREDSMADNSQHLQVSPAFSLLTLK